MNIGITAEYFFYMFLRVAALFTISPVFGRRNVPTIAKVGLSLIITYILIGIYPPPAGEMGRSVIEVIEICLKQVCAGLTTGLITTLFFAISITAGQLIDMQIGFSIASIFDPQYNAPIPLVGNLLNIIMLICFFLADGHHTLIRIVAESFRLIPVGDVVFRPQIAAILTEIFIKTFLLSVKVAMPILAASLICELVMGVLMRIVPQINFFVIGFPIKIAIGLLVFFAMIPAFVNALDGIFNEMYGAVEKIFGEMIL